MNLHQWLAEERGRRVALSAVLSVAPAYMSQMATGTRPVPPAMCPAIERHTAGAVMRWDLRDDWRDIWPELAERADAPPAEQADAATHAST